MASSNAQRQKTGAHYGKSTAKAVTVGRVLPDHVISTEGTRLVGDEGGDDEQDYREWLARETNTQPPYRLV